MAPPAGPLTSAERRHWEALASVAARNLSEGRIGGVIAQLRQRGHVATRRANVFLGFLLVGYYIGLPLWRAYADGTIRSWQDQLDAAKADSASLDARRAEVIGTLTSALAMAPDVVRPRSDERFATPLALADGTLIAGGDAGTILRSTDGGASWPEARPRSATAC